MEELNDLLSEIRQCRVCAEALPLGPRPIVQAGVGAGILIIGQAPGSKVHASGVPWQDASGRRLREWLTVSEENFYDPKQFALVPMGFCFPGTGSSGDLPPRPECAPLWHARLLASLPQIRLTLLVGSFAQRYYLQPPPSSVTDAVKSWLERSEEPDRPVALPHPSPRNNRWLTANPWFEEDLLPKLRARVRSILDARRASS